MFRKNKKNDLFLSEIIIKKLYIKSLNYSIFGFSIDLIANQDPHIDHLR